LAKALRVDVTIITVTERFQVYSGAVGYDLAWSGGRVGWICSRAEEGGRLHPFCRAAWAARCICSVLPAKDGMALWLPMRTTNAFGGAYRWFQSIRAATAHGPR